MHFINTYGIALTFCINVRVWRMFTVVVFTPRVFEVDWMTFLPVAFGISVIFLPVTVALYVKHKENFKNGWAHFVEIMQQFANGAPIEIGGPIIISMCITYKDGNGPSRAEL
ncbi:hypothetical protein PIB30_022887 [Stylosanthes scabra]|uniref:Uncharacterized protein n=1 Tax=Stylosanthes scabra TaxID=79078 RepID=A0ABU6Y6E1_9FABA|nr:hypothetical protein [Stylosanthes scabra]